LKGLTPIVAVANSLLTADHKDDNQQFVEALLSSELPLPPLRLPLKSPLNLDDPDP
jgi:hypothetical protein